MLYFVFENKGVIDAHSITTFGVSSKDDPSKAIGFFGTGLKYAIAIIMRLGGSINIYSAGERYSFGLKTVKVRNDTFDFVTMTTASGSGQPTNPPVPLGFTTELGKTWEVWQALRELECNCRDENGKSFVVEALSAPPVDGTRVVVTGLAFEAAWNMRDQIFLKTPAIARHEYANIHPGESEHVYYRGVRVHKLQQKSRYTYDIQTKVELTEDRTMKYGWYAESHVSNAVAGCADMKLIEQVITTPNNGHWEKNLGFAHAPLSPEFETVALRLIKEFNPNLNKTVLTRMREHSFENVVSDDTHTLTPVDKLRLEKALGFLRRVGHTCDEYPIIVSENLGEGVLGRAHERKIYLSKRVFMMGTKMLTGTILEEHIHLKHGLEDCDRGMQNWLLDALISMGEQVTGEVL